MGGYFKWIALFILFFALLLAINFYIGYNNQSISANNKIEKSKYSETKQLMIKNGCLQCHGNNFEGTVMAPGFVETKYFWNCSELIKYLKNTSDFEKDKRVGNFKEMYRSLMPSYAELSSSEINDIAELILSIK